MALIVEDSTGLANANSYCDLVKFKEYCDTLALDYTEWTDTQIEGALITATTLFIDIEYQFKGVQLNPDQALQLPTDTVSINAMVIAATVHCAIFHLNGVLLPSGNDGLIKRVKEKIDVIETETEYQDGTYTKQSFSMIDGLLRKYTVSGQGGVSLSIGG